MVEHYDRIYSNSVSLRLYFNLGPWLCLWSQTLTWSQELSLGHYIVKRIFLVPGITTRITPWSLGLILKDYSWSLELLLRILLVPWIITGITPGPLNYYWDKLLVPGIITEITPGPLLVPGITIGNIPGPWIYY